MASRSRRFWTITALSHGSVALVAGVWSLAMLLPRQSAVVPYPALLAMLFGAPASVLLAIGGVIAALIGLTHQEGRRSLIGLALCVVALLPALASVILALTMLTLIG